MVIGLRVKEFRAHLWSQVRAKLAIKMMTTMAIMIVIMM
jgi:hypothetical protein